MAIADIRLAMLTFPSGGRGRSWTRRCSSSRAAIRPSRCSPARPRSPAPRSRCASPPSPASMRCRPWPRRASRSSSSAPTNAAALFGELATRFSPTDQTAATAGGAAVTRGSLRKALPDTYLAPLAPGRPAARRSSRTAEEFGCAHAHAGAMAADRRRVRIRAGAR